MQLAYDALSKHWGVRLRKAKSQVVLVEDDPMEIKQEQQDYQRALLGDECDERDDDDVVVLDDPYFDSLFPHEVGQGDAEKGGDCDVKEMGVKPVGEKPVGPHEIDDVACTSSASTVHVASIKLRMQQIQSLEISNWKHFSNFFKGFKFQHCFKDYGYYKCRGPVIFSCIRPSPAVTYNLCCPGKSWLRGHRSRQPVLKHLKYLQYLLQAP